MCLGRGQRKDVVGESGGELGASGSHWLAIQSAAAAVLSALRYSASARPVRGAGLVAAVAFSENDQPSHSPCTGSEPIAPTLEYSQDSPWSSECQYDQ